MKLHLVQPACEIDDNFSSSMVVDDLKLTNVTCVSKKRKHTFTQKKPANSWDSEMMLAAHIL